MSVSRTRLFHGKKGLYSLEFSDRGEGGVMGKAFGPVQPGGSADEVSTVVIATGGTDDNVERLLVDQLTARGA
jgi:hypothetical protein